MVNILNLEFRNSSEACLALGLEPRLAQYIDLLQFSEKFDVWISLLINHKELGRSLAIGGQVFESLGDAMLHYKIDNVLPAQLNTLINQLPVKHPDILDAIFNSELMPEALMHAPVPANINLMGEKYQTAELAKHTLGVSIFTLRLHEYVPDELPVQDLVAYEINEAKQKFCAFGCIFDSVQDAFAGNNVSQSNIMLIKNCPALLPEIITCLAEAPGQSSAIQINIEGHVFESFSALARHFDIDRKTLSHRLKGFDIDTLNFDKLKELVTKDRFSLQPGVINRVNVKGIEYQSESQAAKAWGLSKQVAHARLAKLHKVTQSEINWAYTTPPKGYEDNIVICGEKYSSIRELAQAFNLKHITLQKALLSHKAKSNEYRFKVICSLLGYKPKKAPINVSKVFKQTQNTYPPDKELKHLDPNRHEQRELI